MYSRGNSCALELEAVNYFKLDVNQIHQLGRSSNVKFNESKSYENETIDNYSIRPVEFNSTSKIHNEKKFTRKTQTLKMSKNSPMISETVNGDSDHNRTIRGKKETSVSTFGSPVGLNGSSSASTNSLPSISSSPSISPSLVCPHLSLEDILDHRNDTLSPHTIGLCAKCRMNPPPNIHSPLSPAFKPSFTQILELNKLEESEKKTSTSPIKRGYSDYQIGANSYKDSLKKKSLKYSSHDESLDYFLEPNDLKRFQLSPTLRHSVGFIRNNTTEAGRVIKIHKNGFPFERPLRICVMRGEFASLNHLLDYINSRQLIPGGARYLFHIDGQLVYSENELKHGSIYIVSGTRNFDFRANKILKEQLLNKSSVRLSPVSLTTDHHKIHCAQRSNQVSNSVTAQKKEKNGVTRVDNQKKCSVAVNDLKSSDQRGIEGLKLNNEVTKPKLIRKERVDFAKVKQKSKERYDNANELKTRLTSTSQSNERLADLLPKSEEKNTKVVRAKSEMSTLPMKRKKNVTFLDTGRDSSPAINTVSNQESYTDKSTISNLQSKQNQAHKIERLQNVVTVDPRGLEEELNANEIGIQVSDSLDGYLVDLPIPFPSEPQTGSTMKNYLRKGQGTRLGQRAAIDKKVEKASKEIEMKRKHQLLGIREKQLSIDEINNIQDLDHGDHHEVKQLNLLLTTSESGVKRGKTKRKGVLPVDGKDSKPCKDVNSFPIVSKAEENQVTSQNKVSIRNSKNKLDDFEVQWQYPKGRESSATPTERPVSQCEANESVNARVTTPTPSLSNANDSGSLVTSHEAPSNWAPELDEQIIKGKKRLPVVGMLRDGLDPPARNLKLVWVNGVSIGDQQSDAAINSHQTQLGQKLNTEKQVLKNTNQQTNLPEPVDNSSLRNKFNPSDRFANWICLSKKYNELIYPAGNLIVLWCRSNNEQRYYSCHTSSVSALTLASLDPDLAASAQVADQKEDINPCVHLWSLDELETLSIIEDNHFKSSRIFSLRLKNTSSEGCELSASAKDSKRIWLHIFLLNLNSRVSGSSGIQVNEKSAKDEISKTSSLPIYSLQASKLLQNHQIPLGIICPASEVTREMSKTTNRANVMDDIKFTFGRQHLMVWFLDRKKRQLLKLESTDKNSKLFNSIIHGNCMECISSRELLLGDSEGGVNLLTLDFVDAPSNQKTNIGKKLASTLQYDLKSFPLVELGESSKFDGQSICVTCITRISNNTFVTADSSCNLHFWLLESKSREQVNNESDNRYSCKKLSCLQLPRDFGFISTIIVAKHNRKVSLVEFYAATTRNAILFGSMQLSTTDQSVLSGSSSSITVVYEGHETSIVSLVADSALTSQKNQSPISSSPTFLHTDYFTCSQDFKICKWSGKNLIWKSMLPSSCASLAVHPTGFVLAVGSADGTVYILDKISGLLISYFPLTPVCINCLAYSRDGSLLAAGCANGSMFILPVYERGLKYKKVSIFQSPHPVVSLQFSMDNRYILTSVTNESYQELILWDLPNFRYMRDNVKLTVDRIDWYDSICSGSEDVRAIWENDNLASIKSLKSRQSSKRLNLASSSLNKPNTVINLSCHRLILSGMQPDIAINENLTIASDTQGYLRLFRYPCNQVQQGFYEIRVSSFPVNCCRFLRSKGRENTDVMFVSTSIDGYIFLWTLM